MRKPWPARRERKKLGSEILKEIEPKKAKGGRAKK